MDTINIGRAYDNDLVLADQKVSRYHARLFYKTGRWWLADLKSTHGTEVNGVKIKNPITLKPLDSISLGDSKLSFDGSHILSESGKLSLLFSDLGSSSKKEVESKPFNHRRIKILASSIVGIFLILGAAYLVITDHDQSPVFEKPREPVSDYGVINYDGGLYTGELKNNLPHGVGTLNYESGSTLSTHDLILHTGTTRIIYEGEWRYGQRHGYGRVIYPGGKVIEGYWKNDVLIDPIGN